jgi:hypothetical protein
MLTLLTVTIASLAFLGLNVVALLIVLAANRARGPEPPEAPPIPEGRDLLDATELLGWEFAYARVTASEAMDQRHTMVNFYLLAAGIVASGVVAVLSRDANLPRAVGTVLLWLLCGVGWVYFLGLVRLRQAWHDSARCMNQIKRVYISHAQGFTPDELRAAFRWQEHTLPRPDKPWTVFFLSAALIGLLDSVAFVGGGLLLAPAAAPPFLWPLTAVLALLGLAYFGFHLWLYGALLRPGRAGRREEPGEAGGSR